MLINKLTIFNLIKKMINIIFFLWILVILIGSLFSNHLFSLNFQHRHYLILGLIILIPLIFIIFKLSNKLYEPILLKKLTWKYKVLILLGISILVFLWQLYFIYKANTGIGFDVGYVVSEVITHNNISNDYFRHNYFSFYPNNLLLLYTEYFWSHFFGVSWLSFSFLSLLCVDIFTITTLISIYLINKTKLFKTWSIFLIWLSVFPYIIVPYTDTLVLPLISTYILGYILIKNQKLQILGAILFGTFAMLAYLMKPTSIIPLIAIILVELLFFIFKYEFRGFKIKNIIHIVIVLISALSIQLAFQTGTNNQKFVNINKNLKIPVIHFISMGMHGEGGFDPVDAVPMYFAHNSDEMNNIAKRNIKTRISDYTPYTYVSFLVNKNYNNTADGSFGWLQEGNFIVQQPSNFIQNIVYPNGKYLNFFYVIVQILWILSLLLLLITNSYIKNSHRYLLIFKVALIGGLIYLLLFEGGRSRYIIQFLPVIIPLLGISSFSEKSNVELK